MTMTMGAATSPVRLTTAPLAPAKREPTTIETLTMLGPGSDWQRDRVSVNSSSVSQALRSTSIRRAQGSTPPKPARAIDRKA